MNLVKLVFALLLSLAGMLLVASVFIPAAYRVERSTIIDAPAQVVYSLVNDLRKNESWSPKKAADPAMEYSYGRIEVGLGAEKSWKSDKVGNGSLRIIKSVPYKRIETYQDLGDGNTVLGYWDFEPMERGLKVTNGRTGDAGWNLVERYMNLLLDRELGPRLEEGLSALKRIAESAARVRNSATP